VQRWPNSKGCGTTALSSHARHVQSDCSWLANTADKSKIVWSAGCGVLRGGQALPVAEGRQRRQRPRLM